jgi:hypothetical protein
MWHCAEGVLLPIIKYWLKVDRWYNLFIFVLQVDK